MTEPKPASAYTATYPDVDLLAPSTTPAGKRAFWLEVRRNAIALLRLADEALGNEQTIPARRRR